MYVEMIEEDKLAFKERRNWFVLVQQSSQTPQFFPNRAYFVRFKCTRLGHGSELLLQAHERRKYLHRLSCITQH